MNTEALLGLLHISSPALPVGAFAYSQGLETAIDRGWCHDGESTARWITALLEQGMTSLDIPVFSRFYQGWKQHDRAAVEHWNSTLLAFRETRELYDEDCQVGKAFSVWHRSLHDDERTDWLEQPTVAAMYALAAVRQGLNREVAVSGFLWSWCENQVASASKAVPLGQTDAQKILQKLIAAIGPAVTFGLQVDDEQIGNSLHHYAMASSWHEQQYSRLFRS
ncbi:MAG: urease accessory protein UreF [Endozoicomonas sp.]